MKLYKIPVSWEEWGIVEVEANSLEEAKKLANEGPLPKGNYVDASFQIDEEGLEFNYENEES